MARRESTSKARPGRIVSNKTARRRRHAATGKQNPQLTAVSDWIETERERLMKAEAVLGFMALSIGEGSDVTEPQPSPILAAETARELVNQAIERLDALYLGRLLKGLPARRTEAPP
jgi:hypothetical protein